MHENGLRIVTSEEASALDKRAQTEFGLTSEILMENAGSTATAILLREYPNAGVESEVVVLAGRGNNAGDAFVIARRLLSDGRRVRVFHLAETYSGAAGHNFEILKKLRAKLTHLETIAELESFFASVSGPLTIVDGILGTGLKGPVVGVYCDVIELINRNENLGQVISLDLPSGVCGTTGAVKGAAIQANVTISFGLPKLGHFLSPGAAKRGKLFLGDISLPSLFAQGGDKVLLTKEPIAELLQTRDRYGHKNSFGHTILVGGSPGRLGAISLAARACQRVGTGLVTLATWPECFEALMLRMPEEAMALPVQLESPELRKIMAQFSSVVLGPGLGMRPDGKLLVERALTESALPMVLDADALNLVAEYQLFELLRQRRSPTVLTPHPGEMARLLGVPKEEILMNPLDAVTKAVDLTHAIVVLKGAATFIASPKGPRYLNHYPNDGMATGGSGDVLSGIIGGLLGQGMEAFDAARLGVFVHSLSGGIAAERLGHRSMTAHDIVANLGQAFSDLMAHKSKRSGTLESPHLL